MLRIWSPLPRFSSPKGDTVSAKAAELCKNAKTDEAKVIAIYIIYNGNR